MYLKQFRHVLESKTNLVFFIFKNAFYFTLLVIIFFTLNGLLYGYTLGLSSNWLGCLGAGYGELIGTIRGIWVPLLDSPGSLWYHLKLFTHYFIAIAPAATILLVFFGFLFAVQIGYFIWGLYYMDTEERLFRDFAKNFRFWIFMLFGLTIFSCSYILLYDARISPLFNSCSYKDQCTTNNALSADHGTKSLNSILETINLHIPNLLTEPYVLGICLIVLVLFICAIIITLYRSIISEKKNCSLVNCAQLFSFWLLASWLAQLLIAF